jgi:hypothetical protein
MSHPIPARSRPKLSWIDRHTKYVDELKAARNNTESKSWFFISHDFPLNEPCFICISCEFAMTVSDSLLQSPRGTFSDPPIPAIACCPMTWSCKAAAVFYGMGNPTPLEALKNYQGSFLNARQ